MSYTSYIQIISDVNYAEDLLSIEKNRDYGFTHLSSGYIDVRMVKKLRGIWLENVENEFISSYKNNSSLGKFLKTYPLSFKEFCCLIDLIGDNLGMTDYEISNKISEDKDLFRKHKIRFESSKLKKYKLVYKIINPLRPLKTTYEVSYRAQLALNNKKYTDEYEQLDLALEEESKRNSPEELNSLYYMINPKDSFKELIVAPSIIDKLKTAVSREREKDKIFKKWGFGEVIQYGRGTTLNFRGPPGTGKTLAANCLAKELGKKLLIVRYDQLQNAYVGGTEKHIQQIFQIAKVKDAILFFDEADAIALNRASLEQSWEMSQVNTLLKELERFEGVCIFATNFSEKYDPAFERRLTLHIDFELPTKEQATQILNKLLPLRCRDKSLRLVDFELTNLSGGDIKNIALNAAGIAAKDKSEKIKREHIEKAILTAKSTKITNNKDETNYIA